MEAAYGVPYSWEWWDNTQFQKYREDISTLIETHYAAYSLRERGDQHCFSNPPSVRFINDVPQVYTIVQSLQIQPQTDFKRRIR